MRLYLLLLLYIIPLACSRGSSDAFEPDIVSSDMETVAVEKAFKESGSIAVSDEYTEQKQIRESFLRFETQDLDKTYNKIITFVKQNNGFVQDDNSTKSYTRISRNLIIRIPSNNFQKTIDSISKYVSFFDTKSISSKDVTEEFIDIEARLKAKQTLEKRYLELLSKAITVKEILEIERELSNIREEIEAKQGRLKYLQNKVSLSTLQIEFYKITSETGITVSYGTKMWNAIKSGFNGMSIFFLGILHIWPFILILILMLFLIRRWYNKKQMK
jgi:hypothetical protein